VDAKVDIPIPARYFASKGRLSIFAWAWAWGISFPVSMKAPRTLKTGQCHAKEREVAAWRAAFTTGRLAATLGGGLHDAYGTASLIQANVSETRWDDTVPRHLGQPELGYHGRCVTGNKSGC